MFQDPLLQPASIGGELFFAHPLRVHQLPIAKEVTSERHICKVQYREAISMKTFKIMDLEMKKRV
jgi:hypothetical protein